MSEPSERCDICAEPAEAGRLDTCGDCGRRFHLSLRTDLDVRSCGAAVTSGACGWSVVCNECAAQQPRVVFGVGAGARA